MDDNIYVKDLWIFQPWFSLENIVIVDNSGFSFGFQVDNGVPILSYYDSQEDKELFHLIEYMELLSQCDDIWVMNREAFKLLDTIQESCNLTSDREANKLQEAMKKAKRSKTQR